MVRMVHLVAPNPKESYCISAEVVLNKSSMKVSTVLNTWFALSLTCYYSMHLLDNYWIYLDIIDTSALHRCIIQWKACYVFSETCKLFLLWHNVSQCYEPCLLLLILGSPPPKEEMPSARQTVCPQGATRRYWAAGQLSTPEDGAVCCAVHWNQSLRGLCQVWLCRFRLALLWQHGWPWW